MLEPGWSRVGVGIACKLSSDRAYARLDQIGSVPVDVHVWRIACRDYDASLAECKSLTPAVYARVGDLFRERFGEHAGWAHQLLFAAELQQFRPLLPAPMVAQMESARAEEKEAKAKAKAEKNERAAERAAEVDEPEEAKRPKAKETATPASAGKRRAKPKAEEV